VPAPPPNPNRGSCELRHWTVFAPGYWKGRLYAPADLARMAANYRTLRAHLTPIVKLGHDVDQVLAQRLEQSLGFLNMGQVTNAGLNPDGSFWIDAKGIPIEVGAQINAGRINTGSVDLDPKAPQPSDPAKILVGPIFLAISLLGEEQPALKDVRLRMPQAVFADGSPVPPATSAAAWLEAMGEITRATFSALSGNRRADDHSRQTLCFSDYCPSPNPETKPVDPQALIAALKALPPEQLQALLQQVQGQMSAAGVPDAPGATMPPAPTPPQPDPNQFTAFADDPDVPDWGKAMMSAFSNYTSNCTQRMGAMESAIGGLKPTVEQAAAFSAEYQANVAKLRRSEVERDVQQAIVEGRLQYRDKHTFVDAGLAKSTTATFSDGADKGKSHYEAWRDELLSRNPSFMFSEEVADGGHEGTSGRDAWVEQTLALMPGHREPAYRPASTAAK
jgi:hypothetical protein